MLSLCECIYAALAACALLAPWRWRLRPSRLSCSLVSAPPRCRVSELRDAWRRHLVVLGLICVFFLPSSPFSPASLPWRARGLLYVRLQQPDRAIHLLPRLEHHLCAHTARLNAGKARVWNVAALSADHAACPAQLPTLLGCRSLSSARLAASSAGTLGLRERGGASAGPVWLSCCAGLSGPAARAAILSWFLHYPALSPQLTCSALAVPGLCAF